MKIGDFDLVAINQFVQQSHTIDTGCVKYIALEVMKTSK